MNPHSLLIALAASLLVAPAALGGSAVPANPVVNGGFELSSDQGISTPADAALNTCIGVGHQVFWGSESLQADLVDRQDPESAAARVTADPAGEAARHTGVGHCVYGAADGYDVAWVVPARQAQRPAVGWSTDVASSALFGDFDGDGDREMRTTPGAGSGHNMWQSWASAHQAFTADFDALEFRIENGVAPTGAVILSLSVTPLHEQTADLALYFECQITFSRTLLAANTDANGVVRVDPALASFQSRYPNCNDLAAQWATASAAERHDILASLRIVQLSFWNFNGGTQAIQIDDVALANARSAAEGALVGAGVL